MPEIIKTYSLKCKTITPIHIGSKYELEPLDYVVTDDKKLCIFDLHNLTDKITSEELKSLLESANKKNLGELRIKIRNLFINKYKDKISLIRKIDVSDGFYKKYKEEIDKGHFNNNLSIKLNIESNNQPIIPGSSIKGAIRTCVLEGKFGTLDEIQKNQIFNERYDDNIEPEILKYSYKKDNRVKKDMSKDPFKIFKVRDVILPENSSIIIEVRNKSASSKNKGIPIYLEAIKPGIEFNIEIEIAEYFKDSVSIANLFSDLNKLFNFINVLNLKKTKNEVNRLKNYNCFEVDEKSRIEKNYNNIIVQQKLLRLGFGSGYDFVTVEGYRNMKEPRKGKPGQGWGYSKYIVTDSLLPLGFISINNIEEIKIG